MKNEYYIHENLREKILEYVELNKNILSMIYTVRVFEIQNILADQSGTRGWIRTTTGQDLALLPLPIGLREF